MSHTNRKAPFRNKRQCRELPRFLHHCAFTGCLVASAEPLPSFASTPSLSWLLPDTKRDNDPKSANIETAAYRKQDCSPCSQELRPGAGPLESGRRAGFPPKADTFLVNHHRSRSDETLAHPGGDRYSWRWMAKPSRHGDVADGFFLSF